ncbi:MAG: hypothetical protein ABI457_06690 [Hyphomicrobium sp.]|jgi:hypothetical protein
MSVSLLLAAGSIAAVTYVGMRDHRAAKTARRGVLDDCVGALDRAHITHAADSFPRLAGHHQNREVRVNLLCDTMTIRRLPQLWMSTTLVEANAGLPGFDILVRPAGTEFYSLTSRFAHRLETPVGFPDEVLIRGDDGAEPLLDELRATLVRILADPRVKEIAVTPRGLRIVRQAGEGKRGDYLLLRQSVFESAAVPRRDLAAVLEQLQAIRAITGAYGRARAA